MPWMKAPYDSVVNSLSGHCIPAKAGEVVHVPEVCRQEAHNIGWVPAEEPAPEVTETQSDVVTQSPEQVEDDRDEFQVELDSAVLRILARNNENDLKADGVPKLTVVRNEMSPDVKKPTSTEVVKAFERMQDNINLAD